MDKRKKINISEKKPYYSGNKSKEQIGWEPEHLTTDNKSDDKLYSSSDALHDFYYE